MDDLDVSRETRQKLAEYVRLLQLWSNKINLVSPSTLPNIWSRHIYDSAQLASFLPKEPGQIIDLGSGGGLPGIVIAIVTDSLHQVELVESDSRKAVFLNEVRRSLSLNVKVTNARIETLDRSADILTARALASVSDLLAYSQGVLKETGFLLLLKGRSAQSELEEARENWNFQAKLSQSKSSVEGNVLKIEGISRA